MYIKLNIILKLIEGHCDLSSLRFNRTKTLLLWFKKKKLKLTFFILESKVISHFVRQYYFRRLYVLCTYMYLSSICYINKELVLEYRSSRASNLATFSCYSRNFFYKKRCWQISYVKNLCESVFERSWFGGENVADPNSWFKACALLEIIFKIVDWHK